MGKAGITGEEWTAWGANFVAHLLAGAIAWWLFGGRRLLREKTRVALEVAEPFTTGQRTTLLIGIGWVLAVVLLKVNLGLASFAAAGLVVLLRAGEDSAMLKSVPWSVLVMVCGVSVLIGVLEQTGGMELFTAMLAKLATPDTVNGMIAFVTGLISSYSSTAAVVYPTFLPTVPGLVTQLGGGDPLQIALSINVGAALGFEWGGPATGPLYDEDTECTYAVAPYYLVLKPNP
jgi:Na+/H+ antiporter NhaD/arsenite permease-like protein